MYIAIERDRWYVNDRMEEKYAAGINRGKEEGKAEGKLYNVPIDVDTLRRRVPQK